MIDYNEDWLLPLLFRRSGSVSPQAALRAAPAIVFSLLLVFLDDWAPGFREESGMLSFGASVVWSATTAVLVLLIGFRARQAYGRFWEGTGLLHQMRGEWFDTVSNCVSFSISVKKHKPAEVMAFRHVLVRLVSMAHGAALEEISGSKTKIELIDPLGLDCKTLAYLKECSEVLKFDKVEAILHLTQTLITSAMHDGLLAVPPPILSRVYQTLSRGFVNLLNSKKIRDTKFPFPFVQLISLLLTAQVFLTPLMLSAFITSRVLLPLTAFLPIFGFFSMNYIAIQLENPFGDDENDLPLENFQHEMNSGLLMLLHPKTDIIVCTSPQCVMDFSRLLETVGVTQKMSDDDLMNVSTDEGIDRFDSVETNENHDMPTDEHQAIDVMPTDLLNGRTREQSEAETCAHRAEMRYDIEHRTSQAIPNYLLVDTLSGVRKEPTGAEACCQEVSNRGQDDARDMLFHVQLPRASYKPVPVALFHGALSPRQEQGLAQSPDLDRHTSEEEYVSVPIDRLKGTSGPWMFRH